MNPGTNRERKDYLSLFANILLFIFFGSLSSNYNVKSDVSGDISMKQVVLVFKVLSSYRFIQQIRIIYFGAI